MNAVKIHFIYSELLANAGCIHLVKLHFVCCTSMCVRYCIGFCAFSETNLKVRQALTETSVMGDNIEELSSFNGQSKLLFSILRCATLLLLNVLNITIPFMCIL